jgi:predicted DNA-binding transcriptional regulator AlpA
VKTTFADTDTAAVEQKSATNDTLLPFGDKRAVAALAGGMSRRWVDGELAKGMPHVKLGPRRVRFDMEEVRAWLREKYAVRRRGPARVPASVPEAAKEGAA